VSVPWRKAKVRNSTSRISSVRPTRGMVEHRRPATWSAEAIADLEGIWDYYEHVAGGNTAEDMIRELHEACQVLEDHARVGRARAEIRQGLRSFAVSSYIIFYQVDPKDAQASFVCWISGKTLTRRSSSLSELICRKSSNRRRRVAFPGTTAPDAEQRFDFHA